MTIFSSFSDNFPPHYHTILAINCVHALNWFTHLQPTRSTMVKMTTSFLLCRWYSEWCVILRHSLAVTMQHNYLANEFFYIYFS